VAVVVSLVGLKAVVRKRRSFPMDSGSNGCGRRKGTEPSFSIPLSDHLGSNGGRWGKRRRREEGGGEEQRMRTRVMLLYCIYIITTHDYSSFSLSAKGPALEYQVHRLGLFSQVGNYGILLRQPTTTDFQRNEETFSSFEFISL